MKKIKSNLIINNFKFNIKIFKTNRIYLINNKIMICYLK